jgi:hypothetical protein
VDVSSSIRVRSKDNELARSFVSGTEVNERCAIDGSKPRSLLSVNSTQKASQAARRQEEPWLCHDGNAELNARNSLDVGNCSLTVTFHGVSRWLGLRAPSFPRPITSWPAAAHNVGSRLLGDTTMAQIGDHLREMCDSRYFLLRVADGCMTSPISVCRCAQEGFSGSTGGQTDPSLSRTRKNGSSQGVPCPLALLPASRFGHSYSTKDVATSTSSALQVFGATE